jgi:hypothetical protein
MKKSIYILFFLIFCPALAYLQPYSVSGNINRSTGAAVPDVTVNMSGDVIDSDITDLSGFYEITGIAAGSDITLSPELIPQPPAPGFNNTSCISVRDILRLRNHILNINPLSNPYLILAADATGDGAISTPDLIAINNYILGNISSFPNSDFWQFIPADYSFPDPSNPFSPAPPNTASINNISANETVNFIGIQTGDVTDCLGDAAGPAFLSLFADHVSGSVGQQVTIDVTVEDFLNLMGLQFSMGWDDSVLQFDQLTNLTSSIPLNLSNFNTGTDFLSMAWFDFTLSGQSLPDGAVLFSIQFTILSACNSPVFFQELPTPYEAVDTNLDPFGINTNDGSVSSTGFDICAGVQDTTIYADADSCCAFFPADAPAGSSCNNISYTLSGPGISFSAAFGPQQSVTSAVDRPLETYAADLDGDGDPDVLVASGNDDNISWYENLGGGSFGPQQVITAATNEAQSVFAIDLDGDGDLDVLSASSLDDKIAWYENLGGGSFGGQQLISTTLSAPTTVFSSDLDGDNDNDILCADLNGTLAWHENLGGGNFGPQQVISTMVAGAQQVYAEDLDGDNDMDVLSASINNSTIAWYENLGGGSFGPQQAFGGNTSGAGSVFATDLDGDNDADVLIATLSTDIIAWYENLGGGSFGPQQIISTAVDVPYNVYAADLDNDGDADVLSASILDDKIAWYENLGSGSFGPQQVITTVADGANSVLAIDLDGDGDLDVLNTSANDDKVSWYENNPSVKLSPGIHCLNWIATDSIGLLDTCSFKVTVLDTVPPNITCPNDTTIILDPMLCTAVVEVDLPEVIENCAFTPDFALNFDGEPEHVIVPNDPALNFGAGNFSFETWIRTSQTSPSVVTLIDKRAGGNGLSAYIFNGRPGLQLDGSGGSFINYTCIPCNDLRDGAWHHISYSINRTANTLDIYVDGIYEETKNISAITGTISNTSSLLIAGHLFSPSFFFTGQMDEVRFWNKALTPAEVSFYKDQVLLGSESGLVGYWPFREGSGSLTNDLSPNANHGTLNMMEPSDWINSEVPNAQVVFTNDYNGLSTLLDTFLIGTTCVTWTAYDISGNTDTCSMKVTVLDTVPPIATCQDLTIDLDQNGIAIVLPPLVDGGSFDNCGEVFLDLDPNIFDCDDIGTNVATLLVSDLSGNTATCTAQITVEDNLPPDLFCPDDIVAYTTPNDCLAPVFFNEPMIADNCGIGSVISSHSSGNIFPVGTTVVIFSATDGSENISSCQFNIEVIDTVPPTLICPADLTVIIPVNQITAVVNNIPPIISDNCGILNVNYFLSGATAGSNIGDASGESFNLGVTIVTYYAADTEGNTSNCSFTVTVIPETNYELECPTDTLVYSEPDFCGATVGGISPIVLNDQGLPLDTMYTLTGATFSSGIGDVSGNFFNVGVTAVNYIVSDNFGNTGSCEFQVTVLDTIPPDIACPNDITVFAGANCEAGATWAPPFPTDNCGISFAACSYESGDIFSIGTTQVTCTATDFSGNMSSCFFTVTVLDTLPFSLTCPNDTTIILHPDSCLAEIPFIQPTINGNCGNNIALTYTLEGGGMFCADFSDALTISSETHDAWDVKAADLDGDGDLDVLSASLQDNKVAWYENLGGGNFGPQQIISNTASGSFSLDAEDLDNDGDLDVVSAHLYGDKVVWYENLGGGNFSSEIIIDGFEDAPNRVIAIDLDNDGDADILNASTTATAGIRWYENLGGGNFSPPILFFNAGFPDIFAADLDNDGDPDILTRTGTTQIGWIENLGGGNFAFNPPISTTAENPRGIFATDLDNDGDKDVLSAFKGATNADSKIVWYENLGGGSFGTVQIITTLVDFAEDVYAVDLDGDGDQDVISASVDDNKIAWYENLGAASFGPQQIISTAKVKPRKLFSADLDQDGAMDILSAHEDFGGVHWYKNTPTIKFPPGMNCINWTAIDWITLNIDTCSVKVNVLDTVPPTFICPDPQIIPTLCDEFPLPDYTDLVQFSDNCINDFTITQSPSAGTELGDIPGLILEDGESFTVTITVTDNLSDQTYTCTFDVTVEGYNGFIFNQDPLPEIISECAPVCVPAPTAISECGDLITAFIFPPINGVEPCGPNQYFFPPGNYTVNWFYVDNQANTDQQVQVINVTADNTPPVALCNSPINLTLGPNGIAVLTTTQVDDGSYDNCLLDTLFIDRDTFTCEDIGANSVTLTAVDQAGNTDQCTAVVNVSTKIIQYNCLDTVCVFLDESGQATIDYTDVLENPVLGACDSIFISQTAFNCGDVGLVDPFEVTIYYGNGTTFSCNPVLIVKDTLAPVISCHDLVASLGPNGYVLIFEIDFLSSGFDNCEYELNATPLFFTCEDIGENEITITATDPSGNTSTCTATLILIDEYPPVALCKDITVYLDEFGGISITPDDVDDGSFDNCFWELYLGQDHFTCSDIGVNIVDLVVEDFFGNIDFCQSNVTVFDTIPPVISCSQDTCILIPPGETGTVYNYPDAIATDNCEVDYNCTPPSGSFFPLGTTTVTCTAVDPSGNTDTCSFEVKVDTLPKLLRCGEAVITCFGGFQDGSSVYGCGNQLNPGGAVVAIVDVRDNDDAPRGINWHAAPRRYFPMGTAADLGQVFGLALDQSQNVYVTASTVYGRFDETCPSDPNIWGPAGSGGVYRIDAYTGAITSISLPNAGGGGLGNICYDKDHERLYVSNFEDGAIYIIDVSGGSFTLLGSYNPTLNGDINQHANGQVPGVVRLGERIWGLASNGQKIYFSVWNRDRGRPLTTLNVNNQIWSVDLDGAGNIIPASETAIYEMPVYSTPPPYSQTYLWSSPVSDIAISSTGKLLLGERTLPWDHGTLDNTSFNNSFSTPEKNGLGLYAHLSRVLELNLSDFSISNILVGNWDSQGNGTVPNRYHANSAGGVSYGYGGLDENGNLFPFCDSLIWSTGDALRYSRQAGAGSFFHAPECINTINDPMYGSGTCTSCSGPPFSIGDLDGCNDRVYGLAAIPYTGNSGDPASPDYVKKSSIYVDLDGILFANSIKTQYGDIEILQCGTCPPPDSAICDSLMVMHTISSSMDSCCILVDLKNNWGDDISKVEMEVLTPGVFFNNFQTSGGFQFNILTPNPNTLMEVNYQGGNIPQGDFQNVVSYCLGGIESFNEVPQILVVRWYQDMGNFGEKVVCTDTIFTDCPPVINDGCWSIAMDTVYCDSLEHYTYKFKLTNESDNTFEKAYLYMPNGGIFTPNLVVFPQPIGPGETSDWNCVTIIPDNPVLDSTKFSFKLAPFAGDTICCHSNDSVCVWLEPCCLACDGIFTQVDTLNSVIDSCCIALDVVNNCNSGLYTKIELEINTPNVFFGSHSSGNGWYTEEISTTQIQWVYNGNSIPEGAFDEVIQFCLDTIQTTSQVPQEIIIKWLTTDPTTGLDSALCYDTLLLFCPPPDQKCVNILWDSVYCLPNGDYQYDVVWQNTSTPPNLATDVIINSLIASGNACVELLPLNNAGCIPPGGTGLACNMPPQGTCSQSFLITNGTANEQIKYTLRLIDLSVFDPASSFWCCTESDTFCINLPDCTDCLDLACPPDTCIFINPGSDGLIVDYAPPVVDADCEYSLLCTPPPGSLFMLGTTTVTCIATAINGQTDTCYFDITVKNDVGLDIGDITVKCDSIACIPITVQNNISLAAIQSSLDWSGSGFTFVGTADEAPGSFVTNNVGNTLAFSWVKFPPYNFSAGETLFTLKLDVSNASPGTYPINFNNFITTEVADGNLNQLPVSLMNGSVTIMPEAPPEITCPEDICVRVDAGQNGAIVNYPPPTVTDDCGATYTCTPPPGSFFPLGSTTVTCVATDNAGQTDTCTFVVEVIDTPPCSFETIGDPEISCLSPVSYAFKWKIVLTDSAMSNCQISISSPLPNLEVISWEPTQIIPGEDTICISAVICKTDSFPPFALPAITISFECPCGSFCEETFSVKDGISFPNCDLEIEPVEICPGEDGAYLSMNCEDYPQLPTAVDWYFSPSPTGPWTLFQSNSSGGNDPQVCDAFLSLAGMDSVYVQAEVSYPDCGSTLTNVVKVGRCKELSCSAVGDPHQQYCYNIAAGGSITPSPLEVSIDQSGPGIDCGNGSIIWKKVLADGSQLQVGTGPVYQPPAVFYDDPDATESDTCFTRYTYIAEFVDFPCDPCGPITFLISLYPEDFPDPNGMLSIEPFEPTPICRGEDLTLKFEPACAEPETWTWYRSMLTGPTLPIVGAGNTNPLVNTNPLFKSWIYSVRVQNGVCPEDTLEILIPVKPELAVDLDAIPLDECKLDSVKLIANILNGYPLNGLKYTWIKDGLPIGMTSTNMLVYDQMPLPGNYWVEVQDTTCGYGGQGFAVSDIETIEPGLEVEISGPCYLCEGGSASLIAETNQAGCSFQWQVWLGGTWVDIPAATNFLLTVTETGLYQVVVTCGNCVQTRTWPVNGCGSCASFEVGFDQGSYTICEDEQLVLSPILSGGSGEYFCSWSPSDHLSDPGNCNPVFTPPGEGVFSYTVTVTDPLGCSASADVEIMVQNCGPIVPPPCTEVELDIDDVPIPSGTYHAIKKIFSDGIVAAGSEVIFLAGEEITLNPGFATEPNALFNAKIAPCLVLQPEDDPEDRSISADQREGVYEFMLSCMPNPFRATTTVQYSLPEETEQLSLWLADATGARTALLRKDEQVSSGYYEYTLDGTNLAPGLYFVVLQADERLETAKIVLIR